RAAPRRHRPQRAGPRDRVDGGFRQPRGHRVDGVVRQPGGQHRASGMGRMQPAQQLDDLLRALAGPEHHLRVAGAPGPVEIQARPGLVAAAVAFAGFAHDRTLTAVRKAGGRPSTSTSPARGPDRVASVPKPRDAPAPRYGYFGPAGTFTQQALMSVPELGGAEQ